MTGFAILCAAVYTLSLLAFPAVGAQAVRDGLALCGGVLLPALFPWLVLAHLLVGLGLGERLGRVFSPMMEPLFHTSGAGAAALALGALGGYPSGAAVVRSLLEQGAVGFEDAQSLLCFCCNAGPAFALSVAGGAVFGDLRIGAVLLAVHLAAALLTGILLRPPQTPRHRGQAQTVHPSAPAQLLTAALGKALEASLHISASVIFFQVLTALMGAALPMDRLPFPAQALLTGVLELSSGVCALTGVHSLPALMVCAFLLSWGGCSVHCQTAALLADTGLSMVPYLRAKLMQGLLSAGLVLLLGPALTPMLSAAGMSHGWSVSRLFPVSVPLGWVIWAVTALALLGSERRPCNSDRA